LITGGEGKKSLLRTRGGDKPKAIHEGKKALFCRRRSSEKVFLYRTEMGFCGGHGVWGPKKKTGGGKGNLKEKSLEKGSCGGEGEREKGV